MNCQKKLAQFAVLIVTLVGAANAQTAEKNADAAGCPDGMKVDHKGNLYVSGPGGLWIISPEGKHLGTIVGPEHPHNFAWGDDDGKTLYLCAKTGLYRIRLNIPGIRP